MDRALLLLLRQTEFNANSVTVTSYTHGACTYSYECPPFILSNLMIAQVHNQIKNSSTVLSNWKGSDSYICGNVSVMLHSYLYWTFRIEFCYFLNWSIFLFSLCVLLHILYIQLQTLKYINCIINCNIVL